MVQVGWMPGVNNTTVKTESVRLRVTTEELSWLRGYADEHERTVASVLRLALKQFYERESK